MCKILEVFNEAFNVFSGTSHPTSNLFLSELWKIKQTLNDKLVEFEGTPFLKEMVHKMKDKFDKYWGDCNLLMSIGAVLDPSVAKSKNAKVVNIVGASTSGNLKGKSKNLCEFEMWAQTQDAVEPPKFELEMYLQESLCRHESEENIKVLEWWKTATLKFKILSSMARDILSIPISSVASESAFSAGGRVLDQFRSSLKPEIVEALICTGDWIRSNYNTNNLKAQSEEEAMQMMDFD